MTTIDQSWYLRPGEVAESASAGGVIVRIESGVAWIALVREGSYHQYILPKGRVEPGEDLETAARREIAEEAGLRDLELVEYLGFRSRLNFRKDRWVTAHYFLFTTTQQEGSPTDPDHIYHLEWFLVDDLPELFWPDQLSLLRSVQPSIQRLLMGRS